MPLSEFAGIAVRQFRGSRYWVNNKINQQSQVVHFERKNSQHPKLHKTEEIKPEGPINYTTRCDQLPVN